MRVFLHCQTDRKTDVSMTKLFPISALECYKCIRPSLSTKIRFWNGNNEKAVKNSKMEQQIFTKNKELNDFKKWALRLGCPLSALPKDLALNRSMKSFDRNSLFNVMNMVRPHNEVKTIRDNILLASASSTSSLLQVKSSNPTLQNDKNVKKVKQSIKKTIPLVEQCKAATITKEEVIYDKGMQVMKLKKKCKDSQGTCIQFEEKLSDLMEELKKEKEFEAFIQNSTPADPTKAKTTTSHANAAIEKTVTILKRTYEALGDRPITNNLKVKIEEELEKITADIPSFVLLQSMKSHNNQQMKLAEKHLNNIQSFETTNYGLMSCFQISITKAKAKIFRMNLEVIELKQEEQRDVERYITWYEQVSDNILQQMRIFNLDDSELDCESICGEYLKEFITLHSNKVLSEYYGKLISHWQTIVSDRNDELKGSEFVISELGDLYGEIDKYYNEIMNDVSALGLVNKKLKYLQELSNYTINSTRNWNGNTSRSLFNNTKSVLDCSTFRRPATKSSTNSTPAKYLNEILMLSNIPNDKWNATLPVNVSMLIEGQLTDIMISPLFSFLTPNAALKEAKLKCGWHRLITNFAAPVKFRTVPDFKKFKTVSTNLTYETEKMSNLVEQIKLREEQNNVSLTAIQKYLNFLLNTSIGSLIPPRRKINGRSYQDYEQEFLCICSLIKKLLKDQSKE